MGCLNTAVCSGWGRLSQEPNIAHALRRGTLTAEKALAPSSCLRPAPCVEVWTDGQATALLKVLRYMAEASKPVTG